MSIALAVHGGAGAVKPERVERHRAEYEGGLASALARGREVLRARGSALDAVTEATLALEDCEWFNAGRGSVLAAPGEVQMSASLMRGDDLQAGAVGLMRRLRNPVLAARALLDHRHTVMVGSEAEAWLVEHFGLAVESPEWFITEARRAQWEKLRARDAVSLDHETQTVGAVARDHHGHLAAATSTGGLANQASGRLSDSAVPGAGTWAANGIAAVSGTGDGDVFMRLALARRIADLVELEGIPLTRACDQTLHELASLGGEGGVIAVSPEGAPTLRMNSAGMFRGLIDEQGEIYVAVFADEPLHAPG